MKILGIDPGTAETGYGLIECQKDRVALVVSGTIKTSPNSDSGERLKFIYSETLRIINDYQPKILAIESLFFNTNAKSAVAVGQAMGVIKLAAARKKVKVIEYPPLKIKMLLTQNGRAKKNHIQSSVKKVLGLKKTPRPTHAADALAVAICHWKIKNGKI